MIYLYLPRLINRARVIPSVLQRCLSNTPTKKELPSNAEIVIAGGGAIGASVAYHLDKYGWKDVLILEQGQAGCGTSWHAAGLCSTVKGTRTQIELALYGVHLYSKLERSGIPIGFKECGSLDFATTKDRAIYLKRIAAVARECGVECYAVGPKEAGELNPLLNTDEIEIALWVPKDGLVNPTDLIQAYLKSATKSGTTRLIEGVSVNGFQSNGKRITGVTTNHGFISCDKFINCAGLWARELGLRSDPTVKIPLHACEHFYIVTKPIDNVNPMLPVTRDFDSFTYIREWSGGLLGGGFEPNPRGVFYKEIPNDFQFQLLEEDYDQFGVLMDGLLHRFPCFNTAEIGHFINGPESFTPDGIPHVSISTEFSNYYIAAGLTSMGIIMSAGVGRAMAELIKYGESQTNMHICDIRRMSPSSNNKLFCHDKAAQTLASLYAQRYPKMVSNKSSVMNSPVHCLLNNKGAVWGECADWARPHYFKLADNEKHVHSFGQPCWIHNVQSELKACEETVGIFDLSARSKFRLTFPNSTSLDEFLEQTCLHQDFKEMKPRDVVETVVHNSKMSLVSTVDIFKTNEISVTLVTEPNQHVFLLSHLQTIVEEYSTKAVIENVTGKYALFGLVGPKAIDVLSELLPPPYTTTDILKEEFHDVDLGYASNVLLARYFMRGVDGWQLFVPVEYSQGLYSMIMETGERYGVQNTGNIAFDSLRIHHMNPSYGSELDSRIDTEILAYLYGNKEKESNISLMQIEMTLPTSENWPWGGESVVIEDEIVGHISSVGYTAEDNKVLGLSFLRRNIGLNTLVSVMVGEDHYEGKVVGVR